MSDETFIGPLGPVPGGDPSLLRRLNPGGRLPGGAAPAEPIELRADPRMWQAIRLEKLNPLVAAAAPLLNLAAQVKTRLAQGDVEALRLRVMQQIDRFERRIAPLGL